MGTRPIIYKYPLDLTGNNPNNLVLGEPHVLPPGVNRAVVPNYGAFFSESLVVREKETGRVLVPREEFKAVQLYQEATTHTGLEVTAALVITNEDVGGEIEIDYQAVGGEFSYSASGLRTMLNDLDLDNRPVRWGDMLGLPDVFPPAPHLHDAGDLYGFEYLVEAIDSLRHAIMLGQEAALGELRQYIAHLEQRLDQEVQSKADLKTLFNQWYEEKKLDEEFGYHLEDNTNPHGITRQQLGLQSLPVNESLLSTDVAIEEIVKRLT